MRTFNYFSVVILFFLFGCSTLKQEKYAPLNSFLETVSNNNKTIIIVIKEKVDYKKALATFKGNLIFNAKTNEYEKEGYQSSLYSLENWNKLSSLYTFDTIRNNWCRNDFKNKKIKFEETINFNKNKYLIKSDITIYSFSEPMNYKENKYVVFYVLNSGLELSYPPSAYVVIMKKENEKWIVVDKIYK